MTVMKSQRPPETKLKRFFQVSFERGEVEKVAGWKVEGEGPCYPGSRGDEEPCSALLAID